MKLLPLIGSLLISATPVQAIETFEELRKTCKASEEMDKICAGAAEYVGTMGWVSLLCTLEEKGRLTKQNIVLTWDELYELDGWTPLGNEALYDTLKDYPECSIKPIP
ncbi:hypothetical protein [Synechococcus sp. CC9616]|uniref:hypothetical protein n=1 Tax=Synechococcus sp. CC9616 TaxID=110663 RepID=UPI0012EC68C7|nr:hypothetical protein [Synechococcus sp. CC9616]